jgi:hypothetical protein
MKKVILSAISILFFGSLLHAQAPKANTGDTKYDLTGRAADHLMFQFGSDAWTNRPDSVKTSGFSRHFNMYFMYDKPFKKDKRYSLAFGAGISSSNIFMDPHTYVDLKKTANTLPFRHLDSLANHFAKQKITTIYFDIPAEVRYYSDPAHPGKSWKLAAGVKLGTLLKAYTKAKNLERGTDGTSIYGKTYIEKQENKRFFNGTDFSLTGRVGYGIVSFDMGYQVSQVLRDGFGPMMNKVSFGITISGL